MGPGIEKEDSGFLHCIRYSSNLIKRVCRNTLQAATQALVSGVVCGPRLRARLAEVLGFTLRRDWESQSSVVVKRVWLTDCSSLVSHLTSNLIGKVKEKRLSIDLRSLRQGLLRYQGQELDKISVDKLHDFCRWIGTSGMLVGCLTKAISADDLVKALVTEFRDGFATSESVCKKIQKRAQRRSKKLKVRADPGQKRRLRTESWTLPKKGNDHDRIRFLFKEGCPLYFYVVFSSKMPPYL
jgi:hypothetical protein